jgi:transposase
MGEQVLTEQLWKRLEPLIPTPARRYRFPGRRRVDNRAALEGILFVVRTGIRWNDLPTSTFGVSGATCWRRLKEWHQAGVWQRLHESLLADLRSAGLLDLGHTVVDSSHLRVLKGGTSLVPARSTGAGWAASTT